MAPEIVYFFCSGILMVTITACALIARRWLVVIEFIIPIFSILITMFALPTWYEDPSKPKLVRGATLLQFNSFIYITYIFTCFFCTSHYSISLAGRAIIVLNNLNISLRRYTAGDVTLLPVLFNFVITIVLIEGQSFYFNREKVKLFLEKEASRQRD